MRSSNQWLINLSKDESLWAKDLAALPSMIHFEYMQLKSLAAQGQVYGVLLQCKDTFETILRIPVIMALVVIDSDPKYKDDSEYNDIMKAFLESPMSMGNWNNLARVIIKNNKKLNLPENLIKILEKTRKLYNTEITAKVSDVVAWRNDTIGHGALKFEGDPNYQEEVKSLLNLLKEYFDGEGKLSIKGLYDSIYFQCSENKLVGDCYDKNAEHDLILHIAGSAFKVSNYINDCDLKWYLFESFYCRKNLVKYSSYIDGKNNTVQNKYFSDLYEKHVLQGNKDAAVAGDYISRAEDLILEYLNMPTDYVKPEKLVELLQEQMDTIGKGVITIFMERGTGKSAFANQMSGFYHSKPLLKNSLSRCYHVSNAALRGVSDFINSINNFRHSKNPDDDLWGSTEELPFLTLESENPAEDMADFLNFYHDKYRKDNTILVIDGIDETTEQSECILNYIPSKEQLDDGVFIVLTTRFSDEETVQGKSKKYIEKATQLADGRLEIRRHDEINIELLKRYIEKHESRFGLNNTIDKDALVKKSDYRILYLRAYLAMKDQVALNNTNESKFVESYMNYLLSFYGINQRQKLKEIAVSIALFPSISIKKYQEYLSCQEITYEFVGLFNDLLPLLTVVHLDGEKVYGFADAAYEDFVIEEYPDAVENVVCYFNDSLKKHLEEYLKSGRRLQTDDLTKDKHEIIINESILFFSEGLLGIWHKSKDNTLLFNLFFTNVNILNLANQLSNDEWTLIGYGFIIKREIVNIIVEGLYLGLQNKSKKVCKTWAIQACKALHGRQFNSLSRQIKGTSKFTEINKYLLRNFGNIKNIKRWFWALDSSNRAINIIKAIGEEYNFAVFKSYCRKDEFERLFGSINSPKVEEQVLNCLIIHYWSKSITNSYDEMYCLEKIKKCIKLITEKRYTIRTNKYILKQVEKKLRQRKIDEENKRINNRIIKACNTLRHYNSPLNNPTALNKIVNAIRSLYHYYDYYKWNDTPEHFKIFHKAFYQRLTYERMNGNIVNFIENISQYFSSCNIPIEKLLRRIIDIIFKFDDNVGFETFEEYPNLPLGGLLINGDDKCLDELEDTGVITLSPLNKIEKFDESTLNTKELEPDIDNLPTVKLYSLQQYEDIIEVNVLDMLETEGIFCDDLEVEAFINSKGRIEYICTISANEKKYLRIVIDWIKALQETNYAESKYTNLLLFVLMTVPVEIEYKITHLTFFEEIPLALEKLVYTADTCAFLFWCFKVCDISSYIINKIQELHGHIYCTDNALVLLKLYFKAGRMNQFNNLLASMEDSIPIIEKSLIMNHLTEAMCEIQKYRFLRLRRECMYRNNFDQYILNGVSERVEKTKKLIKEFSTNEQYIDMMYNIELILEFAWQTKEWKEGKEYCQLFLSLLNDKVDNCNYLQAESVKEEILVLKNCRCFFSYLTNEKDEMLDSDIPMISLYKQLNNQYIVDYCGSGRRVITLFDAISDIQKYGFKDDNSLRNHLDFIQNCYGVEVGFFRGYY